MLNIEKLEFSVSPKTKHSISPEMVLNNAKEIKELRNYIEDSDRRILDIPFAGLEKGQAAKFTFTGRMRIINLSTSNTSIIACSVENPEIRGSVAVRDEDLEKVVERAEVWVKVTGINPETNAKIVVYSLSPLESETTLKRAAATA